MPELHVEEIMQASSSSGAVKAGTVSIIIPLYNQLSFTKDCLESLQRTTSAVVEIILVDNASTDGTAEFLSTLAGVTVIANTQNGGCSVAWNQGARAASSEWIVVLNNDVLLSNGWLEGLLTAAAQWELDIVTPAIREGEYNYNIGAYAQELNSRMKNVIRKGTANGICFMVNRRVFSTIGFFDENFRIGQYEDKDFFLRASQAGFRLGTVGSSFLHHFGSVTQKSMKSTRVAKPYALENKAYFIRKWKLPWWKRAFSRNRSRLTSWLQSRKELLLYRHSLMEIWKDGRLRYY